MCSIEELIGRQPFAANAAPETLRQLVDEAQQVTLDQPGEITRQHCPAETFYLMESGAVQFFIKLAENHEDLLVGSTNRAGTPLGWSGFFPPARYATTIRNTQPCRLLCWRRDVLVQLMEKDPCFGYDFLLTLLARGTELIHQARSFLGPRLRPINDAFIDPPNQPDNHHALLKSKLALLLLRSPFFEPLPEPLLQQLAEIGHPRSYEAGDCLFMQGERADSMVMLAQGVVDTCFYKTGRPNSTSRDVVSPVFYRSRTTAGQMISFASFSPTGRHTYCAYARRRTLVYEFNQDQLNQLVAHAPVFGVQLVQRMLWLSSSILRAIRSRLISQNHDADWLAVCSAVEQASPQLPVTSAIRKLPHLLSNRITHGDAFHYLQSLQKHGNALERTLAGNCLEILGGVYQEWRFHKALQSIYEDVVTAPAADNAALLRQHIDHSFQRAFEEIDFIIHGQEHLPDSPGHIFILNHLVSHPYYALENNFEFALDAHFVSAMILYPRYGSRSIRVVRRGRSEEYGHRAYYDRLGHIYVNTHESNPVPQQNDDAAPPWKCFHSSASDWIKSGNNLVICPEGTSYWSHESPGPFRSGAFRLACSIEPEPLIVPVAVANFDQRLKHATLTAVIHKPVRLSDEIDVNDPRQLNAFPGVMRNRFSGYIREARHAAQLAETTCSLTYETAQSSSD
jgi:CRP-like cAMP-binding protein